MSKRRSLSIFQGGVPEDETSALYNYRAAIVQLVHLMLYNCGAVVVQLQLYRRTAIEYSEYQNYSQFH